MGELLPCPFCGGEARTRTYETESLWSHNQVTYTQVGCDECDYHIDTEPGFEVEAPQRWNTRMTPPQDSVSDVERLRAAHRVKTNGYGVWWNGMTDHQRRIVTFQEAFLAGAVAALAVPINKIGEDARTYADGVEDAAKVADGLALVAGLNKKHHDPLPCNTNEAWRRVEDGALDIATAIRRLSFSTDKGVR